MYSTCGAQKFQKSWIELLNLLRRGCGDQNYSSMSGAAQPTAYFNIVGPGSSMTTAVVASCACVGDLPCVEAMLQTDRVHRLPWQPKLLRLIDVL